ncbi:MAG: hypothetical protein ACLPX9_19130, partial [Rhodomicrobium sp.]
FMRILSAAIIAAFFAAGSVAAYAQDAAPAPAAKAAPKVKCKGKAEADCKAPDCTWTAGTGSAAGKCTKAKKTK